MPQTVWFSLRKSLHCKSNASDVHNPKPLSSILTRKKPGRRSGCSRSISNLRDVIHGRVERPPSCSPRSIGSTDFLNPIAHHVIFNNDLKMHYFNPSFQHFASPTKTFNGVSSKKRSSFEKQSNDIVCHKCSEQFAQWDALQSHHLSKHAGNKNLSFFIHHLHGFSLLQLKLKRHSFFFPEFKSR